MIIHDNAVLVMVQLTVLQLSSAIPGGIATYHICVALYSVETCVRNILAHNLYKTLLLIGFF